jgi:hypothetical protein
MKHAFTFLALELPRKSVKHSSWKKLTVVNVSSYRSATSYKNVLSSRDRLWLLRQSVNSWRVRTKALTLQQFTDRLNNHSRSLGSWELIICAHNVPIYFHKDWYSYIYVYADILIYFVISKKYAFKYLLLT